MTSKSMNQGRTTKKTVPKGTRKGSKAYLSSSERYLTLHILGDPTYTGGQKFGILKLISFSLKNK